MKIRFVSFFLLLATSVVVFAQLKLNEAIHIALENNLSLKAASLKVPLSENEIKKARLYNNPVFNVQYLQLLPSSSLYSEGRSLLHPANSQDWFQLTKKFQVFGQRTHKIRIAELESHAARRDFEEEKRELSREVALKWMDAWKALAFRNLATTAASYLDNYLKDKQDSLSGRVLKEEEKLRYEILDDQYDLQLGQAEQEYFASLQELKILLGTKDSIQIDIADTVRNFSISSIADTLFMIAIANRSDVKREETIKKQSEVNIRYQKSLSFPQPEAGLLWNPQNTIPYAGIYFTQPLPLFDRNHTEVQKARLNAQSSQINYVLKMNEVRLDVNTAYENYKRSKQLVRHFEHNLKDSEKLLTLVKKSYLNRQTSIVDIWEAEQTWIQTNTLYYEAFVNYSKSYIQLLYELNLLVE